MENTVHSTAKIKSTFFPCKNATSTIRCYLNHHTASMNWSKLDAVSLIDGILLTQFQLILFYFHLLFTDNRWKCDVERRKKIFKFFFFCVGCHSKGVTVFDALFTSVHSVSTNSNEEPKSFIKGDEIVNTIFFATRCACQIYVHVCVYVFECVTRVPYSRGFAIQFTVLYVCTMYNIVAVTLHLPTRTKIYMHRTSNTHSRTCLYTCVCSTHSETVKQCTNVLPSHVCICCCCCCCCYCSRFVPWMHKVPFGVLLLLWFKVTIVW